MYVCVELLLLGFLIFFLKAFGFQQTTIDLSASMACINFWISTQHLYTSKGQHISIYVSNNVLYSSWKLKVYEIFLRYLCMAKSKWFPENGYYIREVMCTNGLRRSLTKRYAQLQETIINIAYRIINGYTTQRQHRRW